LLPALTGPVSPPRETFITLEPRNHAIRRML
jgi:hypothetical protein